MTKRFFKIFSFYSCLLWACYSLFYANPSYAQERGIIQSKYFSANDYNAGPQNTAFVEDQRGVLYVGNTQGVLVFNGSSWELIRLPNKSIVRSLGVDSQGIVYVGGYNELGFLQPDKTGKLSYHSLYSLLDKPYSEFGEIWDISCFSDTVIFLTDAYIFRYHEGVFEYWESSSKDFYLSFVLNNEYYVQEMGVGVHIFKNDSLVPVSWGSYFSDIRIHNIFNLDNGIFICTRNNGLYYCKYKNNKSEIKSLSKISSSSKTLNSYFIDHGFYHGVTINDSLFALGSISGDVIVVNKNFEVIDIIDNESIGIKTMVLYLYYQKNQGLWLALDNGICKVEIDSPFRYWNDRKGISGVITDVAKHKNTIYISTTSGVFFTKSGNNLRLNSFYPVKGDFEQAWELYLFHPPYPVSKTDSTILFVAARTGLYRIEDAKATKVFRYVGVNKVYQSKMDPSKFILGLMDGLAFLEYKNGNWIDLGRFKGIEERVYGIAEDSLGNLWVGAIHKGLYRINNPYSTISDSIRINLFDTEHGLPSIRRTWIFDEYEQLIFLVDGELYTFNDTVNLFERYFYESERDTIRWARVDEDIISDLYVTHANDSLIWFSTNQGLFKYTGATARDYFDLPATLITNVSSGDSIIFHGTNTYGTKHTISSEIEFYPSNPSPIVDLGTELKYADNSLTFHYTLPFVEGEKNNLYSFMLNGYDKHWSNWSYETKKEYTNLPSGKYTFKVKAKNLYGIETEIAEFRFTILSPWYQTYLAYFSYVVILIIIIILIVKFYTYRLIKEKEKLEGIVKERTQEILMQKEEIMVQAEHLKDANEYISAKNQELEEQKKEVEQKKDQLEISNATKNKFFRIIAHDLRNPISTLVGSTGYILTDIENFDKEKMKSMVEDLNKLSLTTYNLLENLLDWSTSQMGEIQFHPTPLDMTGVVNETIELVKNSIDDKNIKLEISVPPNTIVFADENMIHNIVRNLVTNAVKFTPDGGKISIIANVKGDVCYLNIIDTGVGISKENLKNLFRIEKHLSTPGTHNEKGSGLGLILCKEFIERNGGEITVESEPTKGSTFTVTLKMHKPD